MSQRARMLEPDVRTTRPGVSVGCDGCKRAEKRSRKRGGEWVACERCGAELQAPAAAVPANDAPAPAPFSPEEAMRITGSDLSLYAKWQTRIEGKGVSLEPQTRGTGEHAQQEDERWREFERAMTIHRRLEHMRIGNGRLHVAVLCYVFLQRTGGEATRLGDLYAEVGALFATPVQRAAWKRKRKSLASAAPRQHGKNLLDAACAAYAHAVWIEKKRTRA